MSDRLKFWIGLAAFFAIYLALRVFWLDGDPGIPAVWEYGYNATDEGYYLDGGKEKFLWGFFVDLPRTESFTYGFSSGTHWLSYLAHLCLGLSTWTWRIPFFAISCLAWMVGYVYLARKSGALAAFLLSAAFSCMPMLVAYERTASNDVLIGSLAVLGYVLATGAGRWRLFAAAAVTGLIVLVKPSVWVLIPVVAAGVLQSPKFKRWWLDLACFVAAAVLAVFVCKLLAALAVLPDAERAGVSIWEIVRRTTTHYPLPKIFDFVTHFRGLSAFPRDPSYVLLGVTTAFVFVLPAALATRDLVRFRFTGNTLLFMAVPAYIASVNVMNTQYTHYFIPALMFLPILTDAACRELESGNPEGIFKLKRVCVALGFVTVGCALGLLFLSGLSWAPQLSQQYFSKIYNFPSKNVWGATGSVMFVFMVATLAAIAILGGLKDWRRAIPAALVSAFCAASVVFAVLPAYQIAPFLHQRSQFYFAPLAVSLVATAMLLVAVFGLREVIPWKRALAPFAVVAMMACYVATPSWRQSAVQLMRPATHVHAQVAKELKALVPEDAIVIGERSNQMFLSLPIRTATTFAANSDPIPVIKSILKKDPSAKLYALADSQHAYNLQHYQKHAKELTLQPVKVFKMPSFGTGALADVYLCKINVHESLRQQAAQ